MRSVGARHCGTTVMAPKQDTVERACGSCQIGAVRGQHDLVDQRIDGGVLDADEIVAALLARRRRSPEVALLVPGECD